MAQKSLVTVTATKIVRPNGSSVSFSSGKDITVNLNDSKVIPTGASDEDCIIITSDGTQITAQVSFDDLNTDISATDSTGS